MAEEDTYGLMGKIARVDLTTGAVSYETPGEMIYKKYIGGAGLGIFYLYNEVPSGVEWEDPENRFIIMSGPLGGTLGPTGTFSIVTKGPMTNAAAATQANGVFGAFIKRNGLDGLIIQGAAENYVYIYIHDDLIEIRDARYLYGKDTWETAEAIEAELGKSENQISVLSIGPAGENLVHFACTMNDRGHVAAHNGPGAVLGAKKVKAVVVGKGNHRVPVKDVASVKETLNNIIDRVKSMPFDAPNFGTSKCIKVYDGIGLLPIKNYTEKSGEEYYKIDGTYYREQFKLKHAPCFGCAFKHCNIIEVTEGPYKGFVGEEAEYECLAAFGPVIGQTDPGAAIMLSNLADRLGMDGNECGWMTAWLMECCENDLISEKQLDDIELTWGNVEGTKRLLENIAYRRGIGDFLAQGVKDAAIKMGNGINEKAIYTHKGNTPRGHDHRSTWNMVLDTSTSSMGSDEISILLPNPAALGLPADTDRNTPEGAAAIIAAGAKKGVKLIMDSLPICYIGTMGATPAELTKILNGTTGWNFTQEELSLVGLRISNLLRCFSYRHGHHKELDRPSKRYASAVLKGPAAGKELYPVWEETRDNYYMNMGWDVETGKPKPETLIELDLAYTISDIW